MHVPVKVVVWKGQGSSRMSTEDTAPPWQLRMASLTGIITGRPSPLTAVTLGGS